VPPVNCHEFKSISALRLGVEKEFTISGTMTSSIVVHHAREREFHAAHDRVIDMDSHPEYLKDFPSDSSIIKDLKLGVLLGRC
jgi:hypothetical protein